MKKIIYLLIIFFLSIPTLVHSDPFVLVANAVTKDIHIIDIATDTAYGPFLAGQLGSDMLLDAVVTPNGQIGIISAWTEGLYFINLEDPTNPTLLGNLNIPNMNEEDIAVTPDGRYLLVTGGKDTKYVAVVDITTMSILQVYDLNNILGTTASAQAVDIASDGQTVLILDPEPNLLYVFTIDLSGHLTYKQTVSTFDSPMNVATSPDGKTVLIPSLLSSLCGVFRIDSPGNVTRVESITLPTNGNASVAFNSDGSNAYILSAVGSPDVVYQLDISAPAYVRYSGIPIQTANYSNTVFYGVDEIVVAPDNTKLYVGHSDCSEAGTAITLIDLNKKVASKINVGGCPVGLAIFRQYHKSSPYDGIYKDIGGTNNLNVYVQTYDNGGTLLLYTFDTINMKGFWCTPILNGVFDGLSINPAINEKVIFDFNTMNMTIIPLGGPTTTTTASSSTTSVVWKQKQNRKKSQQNLTFGMYKFANAIASSRDGIYKDVDGTLNLNIYIQTYDNGGTLLLYTFDTATMVVLWDDQVTENLFDGSAVNPSVNKRAQFNFNTNRLTVIDIDTGLSQNYDTYKFANLP